MSYMGDVDKLRQLLIDKQTVIDKRLIDGDVSLYIHRYFTITG